MKKSHQNKWLDCILHLAHEYYDHRPGKDTIEIEAAEWRKIAVIKKSLISPLRDHWVVNVTNDPDLDVQGSIPVHEYSIK